MEKPKNPLPTRKSMALISTWIGVYPLITLLALLLEPILRNEPVPIQTLVLSLTMVPSMVFVITPVMNSLFTRLLPVVALKVGTDASNAINTNPAEIKPH